MVVGPNARKNPMPNLADMGGRPGQRKITPEQGRRKMNPRLGTPPPSMRIWRANSGAPCARIPTIPLCS